MSEDARLGPVARRLSATQRVLCVEDEADIAAFLRAYFRASGYDFVHIDPSDPGAVIDAVAEVEPDIMLLDLRLRGFSGMEIYRLIRADSALSFMPIILVSAHAEADPTFESPRGLDSFVGKPFNTNALADLVRDRLDAAAALADGGRHPQLDVMTSQYLETRLADEISVADVSGAFSFALIRLTSLADIVADVGVGGRDFIVAALIRTARETLPSSAVFGLTDTDELAVILPGLDVAAAETALTAMLAEVSGPFDLAGGATAPVSVAGGVASYPTHAEDVDELFMAADAALAAAVDGSHLLHRAW